MKFTTTTVKTAIAPRNSCGKRFRCSSCLRRTAIQGFGTSESLIDGPMVTSYTVSNLVPSNVAIPGYTPKGTIYQADISARSDGGTVTPMVRDFSRPRAQRPDLQADRQSRGAEWP